MTTEPKGLTDEAAESAILLRGLAKNDLVKNAPLAVFVLTKAAADIDALIAAAFDLFDLVRPKGVSRDQRSPCSLILSFPEVPTDDDMRAWHEADDTLAALEDERKDWARRFKLNGVTPWDWMTRAQEAEDDRERLTDDVAALVQQNIDLEARAERAEAEVAKLRRVVEAAKVMQSNIGFAMQEEAVASFGANLKELDTP